MMLLTIYVSELCDDKAIIYDDFLKFNIRFQNAYLFKINPIFVSLQKRKKGMIVIRVLLCILMLTEVSAAFADAPDFITISELNKARKKKSFADVDNLLNRKGWLSMSPEKLADNNVSVLEWTYGIDYRMSFERSWKRLCNVVITTTKFNANRFIDKNLSKYRLVLQTRTKTFYRDGNEMVMLKTSDKSHFVTLTFATKDDDYWRMMVATKSDPDVRRLDTYQIGDYIEEEGGILFYVSEDYEYGYILAMTDVDYGKTYSWGADRVDIDGDSPYTTREWHEANFDMRGAENTAAICNYIEKTMDNAEYAAQAAKSYTAAGKTDWYLPSEGQLRTIKDDINRLNRRLKAEGGVSMANTWYWSSTEYDYIFAWAINFKNNTVGRSSKTSADRVRAVRTIRIED
jgi:hypothetical protein